MIKKRIFVWSMPFLSFVAGIVLPVSLWVWHYSWHYNWRNRLEIEAYEDVDYVLQTKLKGDMSYAQRCSDNAKRQIENKWPSEATSFIIITNNVFWGAGEFLVIFDTGDIFIIVTYINKKKGNKIEEFKRLCVLNE